MKRYEKTLEKIKKEKKEILKKEKNRITILEFFYCLGMEDACKEILEVYKKFLPHSHQTKINILNIIKTKAYMAERKEEKNLDLYKDLNLEKIYKINRQRGYIDCLEQASFDLDYILKLFSRDIKIKDLKNEVILCCYYTNYYAVTKQLIRGVYLAGNFKLAFHILKQLMEIINRKNEYDIEEIFGCISTLYDYNQCNKIKKLRNKKYSKEERKLILLKRIERKKNKKKKRKKEKIKLKIEKTRKKTRFYLKLLSKYFPNHYNNSYYWVDRFVETDTY